MTEKSKNTKDGGSEANRLSGRMKRYARVGGSVGGTAAKMLGDKLFGGGGRADQAQQLRKALGGLKGPLMKVAQILATIPDALPREYAQELKQLQSNAPAMGWPFVKRRMAAELGRDWQDRFDAFEREAAAAASLGQVHRARHPDGRALACKLQYPDMASTVEADLKQLRLILSIYRRYDRAIDPSQVELELAARLREELDYGREAKHMLLYQCMLAGEDCAHVPEPIEDLSTDRLLTMAWLDGEPLLNVVDHDLDYRNRVALSMFRAWYVPFYTSGVIHGDPHLGNYSVREDGSVNLLDFGCIRVFPPSFVHGVIELYHGLRNEDRDRAVAAYESWGFEGLDNEMIEILSQWARFLYGPLMEDRVQHISENGGAMYGAEVAAKVHRQLREKGGVRPPREFVLVDRAAIGLGAVFMHLKAEINWHRLFHELIDGFDVTKLETQQRSALQKAGVPKAD